MLRHHFPMFKLIVTECHSNPSEWEWRVCDTNDQPLQIGWKRTREEAKHEGESALFNLLVAAENSS